MLLEQHVHTPTYVKSNILDLVFTNNAMIKQFTVLDPLPSDHSLILLKVHPDCPESKQASEKPFFDYDKADLGEAEKVFKGWEDRIRVSIAEGAHIDYSLFVQGPNILKNQCVPARVVSQITNQSGLIKA